MKSTIRVCVCIFSTFLALGLPPVGAQAPDGRAPDPDLEELDFDSPVETIDGYHRLEPNRIPMYELVSGFFPRIGSMIEAHDLLSGQFLQDEFGIKQGTPQETALLRAIDAGRQAEPDAAEIARRAESLHAIRSLEGADVTRQINREMMLEDARQLGVVWGELVASLGGASEAMAKINGYIERGRFNISLGSNESFENPDHIVWQTEQAFQDGIASVLGQN